MTVAERIDQLETMRRSAIALGWPTTDPVEVERVRARWSALHALLAARATSGAHERADLRDAVRAVRAVAEWRSAAGAAAPSMTARGSEKRKRRRPLGQRLSRV